MTLYNQASQNVRKTILLMTVFLLIIIVLGWAFSYYYGDISILYFAVIFSIVVNVGSYWFSDKIVLRLAGAKPVTRDENMLLWNVVENLSITAGLPMPRLYVIEDVIPNAFATGRNKEHAAVAVTSGLLSLLDRAELEGVIAHELSHIGNKDMLLSTVIVVLVGFITLLSDLFLRMGHFGGGRRSGKDANQIGLILGIAGIVLAILSPIVATLIKLAISRKREFLADASGALLTRYPDGLANALTKIGKYSGRMARANNSSAHLYFSNPFGDRESRAGFVTRLFSTHPPIEERIKVLRAMGS